MDTQPKKKSGPRVEKWSSLTPEVVRNLNIQGIPDKDIGIMYDPSSSYVGKKKKHWKRVGIWKDPTDMREIKRVERMVEIVDVRGMADT